MSKLSVPEAAELLGVSLGRVRQRIAEGSLVAERVGGRWLVDLSVIPERKRRGRPVSPHLVWDAIRRVDAAEARRDEADHSFEESLRWAYSHPDALADSSRRRALLRLLDVARAVGSSEEQSVSADFLLWLSNRADRRLYRAAPPDLAELRHDERVVISGLSHPRSGMQDPGLVEGYVGVEDLADLVEEHWFDPPGVDVAPNVFLHVSSDRPEQVTPVMLAADLAEHDAPREMARALELVHGAFS